MFCFSSRVNEFNVLVEITKMCLNATVTWVQTPNLRTSFEGIFNVFFYFYLFIYLGGVHVASKIHSKIGGFF